MLPPMMDSPSLRRRLDEVLPTDAELESFCLDFFPSVHRRFGGQMERTTKINLLFQLVPDQTEILGNLDRFSAGAALPSLGASAAGPNRLSGTRTVIAGSVVSADSPRGHESALTWRNPLAVLHTAIVAVPVMKYALVVAALVMAVAIATRGFGLDPVTVAGGVFIVSGPMAVLLVMGAAARQSTRLVLPTMVLTWAVLALMVSSSLLLLGSFFFSWPKSTPCLFQPAQCESVRTHSPMGSAAHS